MQPPPPPARLHSTMKPANTKKCAAEGCSPIMKYTMALKMTGTGSCTAVSEVILAMK